MRFQIRRAVLLLAVVAILAPALATIAPDRRAVGASRPNFIVIVVDDLDTESLKFMPNVGELLQTEGATFSQFFATTPLCCPARVSILRGQYSHNHGVLGNTGVDGGFPEFYDRDGESSTLATWLDGAGYRTALAGKYLNGYSTNAAGDRYVPPGWDEWYAGADHRAYASFKDVLNENGKFVKYGNQPGDYMTDVLSGKAVDFVERSSAAGEPFFLFLTPYAPHSPSTPAPRHAGAFAGTQAPRPPSFDEKRVRDKPAWVRDTGRISESQQAKVDEKYRLRLESLLAVDEMVATLVETLAGQGVLDQTYLIFTSDNGIHQGEHRQAHGKQSPYEEVIRVPLVIRGPGVRGGAEVKALTANIDLAPTIADLAGVAVPSFVDGRSLMPLLDGGRQWERRALLIEDLSVDRRSEERDGGGPPVPPFRAIRTDELVYVEYATGERELYDLDRDPYELDNLAGQVDRATRDALASRLAALSRCAGAACRAAEDANPPALRKINGRAKDKHDGGRRKSRGDEERPGARGDRDRHGANDNRSGHKRDRGKDGKRDRDKDAKRDRGKDGRRDDRWPRRR
jgi:arylsulfatase A-like enzyme